MSAVLTTSRLLCMLSDTPIDYPNIHLSKRRTPTKVIISFYSCTSLLSNLTSSPGLKAGMPIYGQPSQRKASPRLQFPHDPTFPCTVKSTSARSSAPSLRVLSCASAVSRLAASSAASFCARPQVQSLHALRRLPTLGAHSGAWTR
jgi:hypothetical protein